MNSFDFKLPQDRQTNTGDSGEAPQPFPTDNIFFTMNLLKTGFLTMNSHSSNRHRQTDRQTDTALYYIGSQSKMIEHCKNI